MPSCFLPQWSQFRSQYYILVTVAPTEQPLTRVGRSLSEHNVQNDEIDEKTMYSRQEDLFSASETSHVVGSVETRAHHGNPHADDDLIGDGPYAQEVSGTTSYTRMATLYNSRRNIKAIRTRDIDFHLLITWCVRHRS